MQLVLGTHLAPALDAGPAAAPPPDWLGLRARRLARRAAWSAAFALVVALGVLQGARVAIGAEGVSALAGGATAAVPAGALERDALRGDLWRPHGSDAVRPERGLAPQRWRPEKH